MRKIITNIVLSAALTATAVTGSLLFGTQPAFADSTCDGSTVNVQGTAGNDTLYVGNGDVANGQGGSDTIIITTGSGAIACGGSGGDNIFGGTGNDLIDGQDGNDFLYGDDGADVISGGSNTDFMQGQAGADKLYGEDGSNDEVEGNDGNDRLHDMAQDAGGDVARGGDNGPDGDGCENGASFDQRLGCEFVI